MLLDASDVHLLDLGSKELKVFFLLSSLELGYPIFFTGYTIDRWEGFVFVLFYVAYTVYLILHGIAHDSAPVLRTAMLFYVAPLAMLTLGVIAWREWRVNRQLTPQ